MGNNLKSEGICKFCKQIIAGTAMMRHLEACEARKNANESDEKQEKKEKIFLMRASTDPFFVYFEAKAVSTLEEVDIFLRHLWLECCGHLSAFTIGARRYCSYEEELDEDEETMDIKLIEIITPNLKFIHEYDFGTTTQLGIMCVSQRVGKLKNKVEVIAINNPPDFRCHKCEKPAKKICSQCVYEGTGLVCDNCAKDHECGEDMLLPLVNSPRTGICGYTRD